MKPVFFSIKRKAQYFVVSHQGVRFF